MADSFIEKQTYIEDSSSLDLIKSKLIFNEKALRIILPLAVFIIALLPRILSLDTFITADEDDQIMFSTHFLKSILRGNFGGALILGYPGIPTLLIGAAGVGLRYLFHYQGWMELPWVTRRFFHHAKPGYS